jgi:hypothetical protein
MTRLRVGSGQFLAAVSGAILIGSLFLNWYGARFAGQSEGFNAWQAFSLISVLLYAAGAAGLLYGLWHLFARGLPSRFMPAVAMSVVGLCAACLTIFRLISMPDLEPGLAAQVSPQVGIFIGLVASVGLLAGGLAVIGSEHAARLQSLTGLDRFSGQPAPGSVDRFSHAEQPQTVETAQSTTNGGDASSEAVGPHADTQTRSDGP